MSVAGDLPSATTTLAIGAAVLGNMVVKVIVSFVVDHQGSPVHGRSNGCGRGWFRILRLRTLPGHVISARVKANPEGEAPRGQS